MKRLTPIFQKITFGLLPLTLLSGSLQGCECPDRIVHVSLTREQAKTLSKAEEENGSIDKETCDRLCTISDEQATDVGGLTSCELEVQMNPSDSSEGTVTLACRYVEDCAIGRRPPSFKGIRGRGTSALGLWFSHVAHLEAAAVYAFAALHQELVFYQAPEVLQHGARRAILDEVVHANLAAQLARRFGGVFIPPEIEPFERRALAEIALDNAVEGCVGETYAALEATWGQHTSQDPLVRDVLAQIAEDETRHAELSWAIERWLREVAPETALWQQIEVERRARISKLRDEINETLPEPLISIGGRPSPTDAARLVDALDAAIWSGVAGGG